jgi:hypothetical protein
MRKLKMKKLMMMLGALAVSAGVQAETIHGVCDDLQGTAGGAYGLCVAICEVPAEDDSCMPTFVDGVLVEDSFENCRPASMKLVNKYLEKANGVELPCGNYTSSVSCPCPDPDVDVTQPYSCIPRPNESGGGVTQIVPEGTTLFTIVDLKARGWLCRTRTKDGVQTILPVPGQEGDGGEIDACLDIYNSYCP